MTNSPLRHAEPAEARLTAGQARLKAGQKYGDHLLRRTKTLRQAQGDGKVLADASKIEDSSATFYLRQPE